MIDAQLLTFTKICIHKIDKKTLGAAHAIAECDTELTFLGHEVEDILKERIKTAFAHRSRSITLELSIGALAPGSFFDLSKDIKDVTDEEFINRSCSMANLLAQAQTSTQIPGGYLIVITALDEYGKSVIIAIKAEINEALQRDRSSGVSKVEIVKDLFLNRGTKLYKIAALYQNENPGKEYPNDQWSCLLYDEQFSAGDKPSNYFWDSFLKFSIENNAKLQTAYFYSEVTNYIQKSGMPLAEKNKAIEGLETLVIDSHTQMIDPEQVKVILFAPEHRDGYERKIRTKFPRAIVKDTSAIEHKLETQNVYFPNGIKLTGDKKLFSQTVTEITNPDELDKLEFNPYRTILVIEGKPSKTKVQ